MNFRLVGRQLGLLLIVTAAAILTVAAWSCVQWLSGDRSETIPLRALMLTVGIGWLAGAALWFGLRGVSQTVGRREAILLVALSWFIAAGLGALPFRLWTALGGAGADHPFASMVDCYFESMSGLTTTGATVLSSIETLPRSLLLWRALTHWLGGLGIVVLFVAVLPVLGVGGKRLFRVEAPGPTPDGVTPRIQETARVLWLIYLGLTVAEVLALKLAGMTWFESVCHTFATLATGGFSTDDASIAGFKPGVIHLVILFFMVAAGINFGLYYQVIRGRWRKAIRDPELHCYLWLILIGTVIVVVAVHGTPYNLIGGDPAPSDLATTIQQGAFQVVSVQTTTGFCTADFDQWGFTAKMAMLALMFVGGSAGSTGGGVKVIRCMMTFKIMWSEIEHVFRPNVVRPVKIGQATIDQEMKLTTMVYVFGVVVLTMLGAAALMVFEQSNGIDVTTAVTASIATLNNIGPGLAKVGATCNYGWFTPESKCLMSVLMALGRLEVLTVVVLFLPRFWRGD